MAKPKETVHHLLHSSSVHVHTLLALVLLKTQAILGEQVANLGRQSSGDERALDVNHKPVAHV